MKDFWQRWTRGWVRWAVAAALVLMLVTAAFVAAVGIFQTKLAAGERERLMQLTRMEKVSVYFYRTQGKLDEAGSRRFILAISQSPVKTRQSEPDMDAKISIKISVGEELSYIYTIAPDRRYVDQYWIYYERDQEELIEVARIRSAWLTHFFRERGLLSE